MPSTLVCIAMVSYTLPNVLYFCIILQNAGYSEEDILATQTSGATPGKWAEIEKKNGKTNWEN